MKQAERFFAQKSLLYKLDRGPVAVSQGRGFWGTIAATTSGKSAYAVAIIGLLCVLIGALSFVAYFTLVQGYAVDLRMLGYIALIAVGTIAYVWLVASPIYGDNIQRSVLLKTDGFECKTPSGKKVFTPFSQIRTVTRLHSGYFIRGRNKRVLRLYGPKGNAADIAAISDLALIFNAAYGSDWTALTDTARRYLSTQVLEFHYGPSVWRVARNSALNFLRGALFITVISTSLIIAIALWGARHEVLTPQSFQDLIELVITQLLFVLLVLTGLAVTRGLLLSPWFVGRVLPQRRYRGHVLEISADGIAYRSRKGATAIADWNALRQSRPVQDGAVLRFIGADGTELIAFPFRFQRLRLMLELIRWGIQTDPAFSKEKIDQAQNENAENHFAVQQTPDYLPHPPAAAARVGLRRRRKRRAALRAC